MIAPAKSLAWIALALAAAPAAGQAPALPPQISTVSSLEISNTVHCTYDQMSTEDREMALLLLEREVGSARKSHWDSPNLKVIDRLVDEAQTRCAVPYAWSRGRADAAMGYAMNELMSEGVAQALEAKGRSVKEVETYFDAHRTELAGVAEITGPRSDAFRRYLSEQGWSKGEEATMAIAEFYLQSLLARDNEGRRFAAAPAIAPQARPGLRARSAPAKSARRGKR